MQPTLNEVNNLTDDKPASQQLSFSSFRTLQLDLKDLFYNTIQYNTITLFKEGSAITFYSFLTYGPQKNR